MNMRIFVESLSLKEMNELSMFIHDKRVEYARQNMKPLSVEEKLLLNGGNYIAAIKEYRRRTNAGLLEAKTAVDSARGL